MRATPSIKKPIAPIVRYEHGFTGNAISDEGNKPMSTIESFRRQGLVGLALIKNRFCRAMRCKIVASSGGYISAAATLKAATAEGLSVGDYVETVWLQPGRSQQIIDRIAKTGVFSTCRLTALEIGAGTGRYMEKVFSLCKSIHCYESYETDPGWEKYLSNSYPITTRSTDGRSLSDTLDHSVDFVCAHGVFVYTSFLTTMSYLREIVRVCSPGAVLAADFITEDCMRSSDLNA